MESSLISTTMFPHQVRFLSLRDADLFLHLNQVSFQENSFFWTDPKHFKWSESEEKSLVWGCSVGSQLISYLKIELFLNESELERRILGIRTQDLFEEPKFPVLYISKAATHPNFRFQGFQISLRELAHEIALQLNVRYLVGTTIEGSPRLQTLQRWGYRLVENPKKWNGSYKSDLKPVVSIFDCSKQRRPSQPAVQEFFETNREQIQKWFQERTGSR